MKVHGAFGNVGDDDGDDGDDGHDGVVEDDAGDDGDGHHDDDGHAHARLVYDYEKTLLAIKLQVWQVAENSMWS